MTRDARGPLADALLPLLWLLGDLLAGPFHLARFLLTRRAQRARFRRMLEESAAP